jgi:hypothetical protein
MLYMKAGWGAREESLSLCQDRLEGWVGELVRVDPLLAEWYESNENGIDPDSVATEADWSRMLEEGRIGEGLGSVIAAWAGSEGGYGLTLHCGVTLPLMPNQLHLSMPHSGGFTNDSTQSEKAVKRTTKIWSPDYVVISDSSLGLEVEVAADGFQPGWMNCVPLGSDRSVKMRRLGWDEIAVFDGYVIHASADTGHGLSLSVVSEWR